MKYVYPACFYPETNGQFSVIFPDLNGIATYGNNLEDAMSMAEDLLCTWVMACKKDNEQLPQPSNIKEVKLDDENAFVNLIVANIESFVAKNNKAVKKTLTLPAWLNDIAEKEGINFSHLLQNALKDKLHFEI